MALKPEYIKILSILHLTWYIPWWGIFSLTSGSSETYSSSVKVPDIQQNVFITSLGTWKYFQNLMKLMQNEIENNNWKAIPQKTNNVHCTLCRASEARSYKWINVSNIFPNSRLIQKCIHIWQLFWKKKNVTKQGETLRHIQ